MDQLTGLSVFIKVAESGGFSAAAMRLKMSTTMVSKHVQIIEERLDVRLLNRTTGKVSLTEIGRDYYQRCKQILHDLEITDEAAAALQSSSRGVLRIHLASPIAPFIAPVVAEYLAQYSQAHVDFVTGIRDVDLTEEGVGLAIRLTLPTDSSMIVRKLATWQHVVCASPAYLVESATQTAVRSPEP